jgi:hypothetical protein
VGAACLVQRLVEGLGEHDLLAALEGRQSLQVAVEVAEVTGAGQGHVPQPERLRRQFGVDPGGVHPPVSLVRHHGRDPDAADADGVARPCRWAGTTSMSSSEPSTRMVLRRLHVLGMSHSGDLCTVQT